jgi:hypothetical protein
MRGTNCQKKKRKRKQEKFIAQGKNAQCQGCGRISARISMKKPGSPCPKVKLSLHAELVARLDGNW